MALSQKRIDELCDIARGIREDIVDITAWAGGAHIGGALSVTDILVLLYWEVARVDPENPQNPDRDRVILSKGHAGVGYAPVLARKGYFDFGLLKDFNKFMSPFGMHLDSLKVKGVDVSTGSLGHGLPMAVGLALGARLRKKTWTTWCILGDGELNEGSIWEAAMAAAHYKLSNIVTFVDRNRLMIDGPTEEVMALEPLADKWKAYGFNVLSANGHDFAELHAAVEAARKHTTGPSVILADTVKGKGVGFMENEVKWHYGGLSSDLVEKAKESIRAEKAN
ncbi:MAG: transketolase [Deltaproteobacteria bacterium]|nr:transketolase [Deltaproteobacteria bacterium]